MKRATTNKWNSIILFCIIVDVKEKKLKERMKKKEHVINYEHEK